MENTLPSSFANCYLLIANLKKEFTMSIDFNVKDILHRIQVRFIHAFLPDAKKPYYLRAVHQPELDIHGIASKAEVYNIGTSPKVIEEGFTAGSVLACYLAADGYKLNTPLFKMKVKVPGEYDGSETHLPHGVYPTVVLQATAQFRKYLREKVKIEFDGVEQADGLVATRMSKEQRARSKGKIVVSCFAICSLLFDSPLPLLIATC